MHQGISRNAYTYVVKLRTHDKAVVVAADKRRPVRGPEQASASGPRIGARARKHVFGAHRNPSFFSCFRQHIHHTDGMAEITDGSSFGDCRSLIMRLNLGSRSSEVVIPVYP